MHAMVRKLVGFCTLVAFGVGFCLAQDAPKKPVRSQADLPRFVYPIRGIPSEMIKSGGPELDALVSKASEDLGRLFRDYDIQDRATLRWLVGAQIDLLIAQGDVAGALSAVDRLRQLQEKPASKLLVGLLVRAQLQAALDTHAASGAAYEARFTELYKASLDALPWDVVQDPVRGLYAALSLGSESSILASAKTQLDPAAATSHALDLPEVIELLSMRNLLLYGLPMQGAATEALKHYIDAHSTEKPDIWAAREVTLTAADPIKPVNVAIWDTGVDISLFPGRVFEDPEPTASGAHGMAFDDEGYPSQSWLAPLSPEAAALYPKFRDDIKGFHDLESGIPSAEAAALQQELKTLSPEELHQRFEAEKSLGLYVHGTHCAGIAARGNAAIRLVVARFNDNLPDLKFAPTVEWAERMSANFEALGAYFESRHVRVVNLSWADNVAEFEAWLSQTGQGGDVAARKQKASELFAIWRAGIEKAVRAAPDTLFVAAAGNSDSDTGFTAQVPAGLHLPNLIAVGAVNQAGEETSFTSYGDTVVVYADGYNVPSVIPGGTTAKLSGTSMAAPNVVNLAAKLYALDPLLTPEQVIGLIRAGATPSADGRLQLIDEQRSVALLRQSH